MPAVRDQERQIPAPNHSLPRPLLEKQLQKHYSTDQTGRQNSLNQLPPGTPQGFSPRVPTFRAREEADSAVPTMPAKATGSESQERQSSLSLSFVWFINIS